MIKAFWKMWFSFFVLLAVYGFYEIAYLPINIRFHLMVGWFVSGALVFIWTIFE